MVSSTVSCSSAAHSVSVSRRMPAQILATPTGWVMKSSPDCAALVGVVLAGERNAFRTRRRSIGSATSSACSETIANRSASSSCSSVVRSSGIAACRRRCLGPIDGRCAATATGASSAPASASGGPPAIEQPRVAALARADRLVHSRVGRSASPFRPLPPSCRCWSGIAVRPRAVAGRPRRRPNARARVRSGLSAARQGRAAATRSSTSPSSARTRTRRPASAADLGCGPSPRSSVSQASPVAVPSSRSARYRAVSGSRRAKSHSCMCKANSSSGFPHARCVHPSPDGWSNGGRLGGSTATTCGERRRQARIVLQRGPRRDREAADASLQRACPMRRVRGHRQDRLPASPPGPRAGRRCRCRACRAPGGDGQSAAGEREAGRARERDPPRDRPRAASAAAARAAAANACTPASAAWRASTAPPANSGGAPAGIDGSRVPPPANSARSPRPPARLQYRRSRSSSRRTPATKSGSPSTSIGRGAAGWAWRSTSARRDRAVPAVDLQPDRGVGRHARLDRQLVARRRTRRSASARRRRSG